MRMIVLTAAIVVALLALAYHFFALEIFNLVVPKDGGSAVLARDVAYGPDADQRLDVYAPQAARDKLPVLVFVHGGSWESGSKDGYGFAGRAFAAQGYLTLVAGYRKRPQHPYPAFVADAAAALAFAQNESARFGGDGSRIVAVGHSAGAYNIAMAILNKRYLDEAGVSQQNIQGVATLAGPFDFLPFDTRVSIETFGQVPEPASTQPINFARGDAPPFLLLTGTADTTVFPRNSIALQARLHQLGAPAQLKQYDGIGHVGIMLRIAKPFRGGTSDVFADVISFLKQHSSL